MRNSTCFVCCVLIWAAIPVSAQVVLTANDPAGTSSFNSAGMWNYGSAPNAGVTFSTAGYCLRTPSVAGNYTFAGDSLTVGGGDGGGANPFLTNGSVNLNCLLNKTPTGTIITVNDLILDAGYIRDGMGTTDVWTLAGNITVTENGGGLANQCRFNLDSVISGSGTLYIADTGNPDPRRTIYWNSGDNTFNGSIRLLGSASDRCRLTFSEGSRMNFAIGASGVNNRISGTGTATYNGVFHIDLMGAGIHVGDNWILTAATVQTFGETFSVAGFEDAGSGIWTTMYYGVGYRFSESTGVLTVTESFYPGSGTAEDPYQIWTPEQMNGVGMHVGMWSHIKLMADLDMSAYNSSYNIIGNDVIPFSGTFDGNGHVIRNLTMVTYSGIPVGLFGDVDSAGHIRNLGLINVHIGGDQNVGGLVDYNQGTITACYATGTVNGSYAVGGLVGKNYQGTITGCYATGTVNGSYAVGGLVGMNDQGVITASYAAGSVSGSRRYVGGLVGWNSGTISACYATGTVGGSSSVGGVVGYNIGSFTACFWDQQTSGMTDGVGNENPDPAGAIGKTTAEMKTLSTFTGAGWDFENTWDIVPNQTYPYLRTDDLGDLNHDGRTDIADFAIFAGHWMEGI